MEIEQSIDYRRIRNSIYFLTERIIRVTRHFPSTVEIRVLERVVGFGRSPDILQTLVEVEKWDLQKVSANMCCPTGGSASSS